MSRRRPTLVLRGISISPGAAMGVASHYLASQHVFRIHLGPDRIASELERLDRALQSTIDELKSLSAAVSEKSGSEAAAIMDVQCLLLEDPELRSRIAGLIRSSEVNAEWAARAALDDLTTAFQEMEDEFFRQRGLDMCGLVDRLQRHLEGAPRSRGRSAPVTLIADALNLALLAESDIRNLAGIVVSAGGYTSHTAIIARSYRIPVISGIEGAREKIPAGARTIVDGESGEVLVWPGLEQVRRFRGRMLQQERQYQAMLEESTLPAVTRDGERILLEANVETEAEIASVLEVGADGVGLFRSEFLYVCERVSPPSEEKQAAVYSRLAQQLYPRPLTIRTLDVGDEEIPCLADLKVGPNPILGLRGIRLSLKAPDLFRAQLAAILRASTMGNVSLAFPMVTSSDEIRQARAMLAEVQNDLRRSGFAFDPDMKVGVVLEVPASFLNASALAAEVDFFSIGTNDLIQYVLAVDRANESIASLYDPLHPAVLRCLDEALGVAARQRIPVRVCGEMASNPVLASVLIGMGVRCLSVNPSAVPRLRRLARSVKQAEAARTARHLLTLNSPSEVHGYMQEAGLVAETEAG